MQKSRRKKPPKRVLALPILNRPSQPFSVHSHLRAVNAHMTTQSMNLLIGTAPNRALRSIALLSYATESTWSRDTLLPRPSISGLQP